MPAPPLLDFAALLAPIPGNNPAGSAVPYDIKSKLKEAREEDNPEDRQGEDPRDLKKAEWPTIVRLAEDTLKKVSKDLEVAARLTEALVRLRGFTGLRDGVRLLRELVEHCWDRLNPAIEDGDLEPRAAPFYWLSEPDKGAKFPSTLRLSPLVFGKSNKFSWLDCRQSQTGKGPVSREAFDQALQEAAPEKCAEVAADIVQAKEELNKLTQILHSRMQQAAPGLTELHRALDDCDVLAREIWKRKRPDSSPDPNISDVPGNGATPAGPATVAPAGAVNPAQAISSRTEAYRQLSRAAAVLQTLEPHSPIPYLIQRAVELGSLPFPQLIKALIRDANVLNELTRELGIKEPPPKE